MKLQYFRPQFSDAEWPKGLFSVEFDVKLERTALLLVDMQVAYIDPNGGFLKALARLNPKMTRLYRERLEREVMPANLRLLKAFRAVGRQIVYTKHARFIPDGRDMILRRQIRDKTAVDVTGFSHMEASDSRDTAIVDALAPQAGDYVVEKNSSSPFNSTGIDQVLRNMNIETLVVTGLATDMCFITTSRDAADRGYNVIAVEDACGTYDMASHEASLLAFGRVYGKVMRSDAVLRLLNLKVSPERKSLGRRRAILHVKP